MAIKMKRFTDFIGMDFGLDYLSKGGFDVPF
jgi:hypothetical protein